jgi:hypothetical protein
MAVSSPYSSVGAGAANDRGEAETRLAYGGKPLRYILTLQWAKAVSPDGGDFHIALVRSGPKEEITAFIEEWLLKFPDSDLVSQALDRCNGKLPEDMRLF